ncbi:hypothetical protein D3C87_181320 [compost metagenome]
MDMKKPFLGVFAALLVLLTLSFGFNNETKVNYGKFGGDGKTAPLIELNANKTFRYLDLTNKNNPIDITGSWKMVEQEVHLLNVSQKKVMKELEVIREGNCLKARKNFAFYTLCHCD